MFRIRHDVYVHFVKPENDEDNEMMHNIWTHLQLIHEQNQKIMDQLQLHLDALQKIDAATTTAAGEVTRIGERITSLEETIKNMGLTAEQESQLLTQTQGVADRAEQVANALKEMGKTPENPVPVEPPVDGGTSDNTGSATGQPAGGEGNPGGTL
jgi:methyl-accepting chemotaxis protein